MLELKNINLNFVKDYFALCNVNLNFENGKIYNIVGQSGSGKSSLLRCVAKLETTYEGEIIYQDKNIKEYDFSNELSVGYLPAKPVLLDKKNIVENLRYAIENRNVAKNSEEENYLINQLLKTFDLDSKQNVKVCKLDYYSQQKIAVARLCIRKVEILLIDNLFDLIDEKEIIEFKKFLEEYLINENVITILASSFKLDKYFNDLEIINIENGIIQDKKVTE